MCLNPALTILVVSESRRPIPSSRPRLREQSATPTPCVTVWDPSLREVLAHAQPGPLDTAALSLIVLCAAGSPARAKPATTRLQGVTRALAAPWGLVAMGSGQLRFLPGAFAGEQGIKY